MSELPTLLWRLIWIGAGAVACLAIALLAVRWIRRRGERSASASPFTLEQVVALRERGELTEVEYIQLRNIVLANLPDRPGFTLHELRQMRQRGEVSEQEYQMVRGAMIARLRGGGGGGPDARDP